MPRFTCADLARLALPDMPRDTSAMIRRARREGWRGTARAARGGGVAYTLPVLLRHLPEPAREALLDHVAGSVLQEHASAPAMSVGPALGASAEAATSLADTSLADWQRRCADARAAILAEFARLSDLIGPAQAANRLVTLARAGTLPPALLAAVATANARGGRQGARTLSRRTLFRWRSAFAASGWRGLVPLEMAGPTTRPAWAPALLKLYRTPSRRPLTAVLEDLPGLLPRGVPSPSYGQARRFLLALAPLERERGRFGPNGLLAFQGFKRRSTALQQPLDVVSCDGYSLKAEIAHPIHGKPFRPELCALMDTTTRFVFGWSAGLSESAAVTMDAIRHGVEQLGAFGIFYTDNGAGFTAKTLTDETLGLLARIGAVPSNSLPGRAQARGKIERLQQSLWGQESRRLITYAGRDHDGETRHRFMRRIHSDLKRVGASRRLPSWAEFLAWAQGAVDAYNARPHRSLPKIRDQVTGRIRHQSPAECLAQFRAQDWTPQTLPQALLDDLFRPILVRTTRRGEVSLPWGRYFARDLVPHSGAKVQVGYNIHDGSRVWVRDQEGRLIAIAGRDANLVPEMPESALAHGRLQRVKAALARLDERRADHLAELSPALIEPAPLDTPPAQLPQSSAPPIDTPMPLAPWAPAPLAPTPLAPALVQLADWAALEPSPFQAASLSGEIDLMSTEAGRARYARALYLQRYVDSGGDLESPEYAWLRSYQSSAEYRTHRRLYEEYSEGLFNLEDWGERSMDVMPPAAGGPPPGREQFDNTQGQETPPATTVEPRHPELEP